MARHWRKLDRQDGAWCYRQSICPTALGSPCPTGGTQWGLSCRILGSCTGLMQAIHVLVLASKDLQREIVESGRVSWGKGCRQGMGKQGLGQPGVTTHLLGMLSALACWGINTRFQELLPQPEGLTLPVVPRVSQMSLISLPM